MTDLFQMNLIGNLTRDPETRTVNTQNGDKTVCTFDVAVNRRAGGKEITNYVRVSAWGSLGDICARYLTKGRQVYVTGLPRANGYTANDGSVRASLEVNAEKVEFLGGARQADAGAPLPEPPTDSRGFAEMDDDELPF